MPIDYSKFDSIEDSDDDGGSSKRPTRANAATVPFAPATRTGAGSGGDRGSAPSRSGHPTLEPLGEDRFRIVDPAAGNSDMDRLASQLEKWGAKAAGEAGQQQQQQQQQQQEPKKPGEPQRLCMKSDGRKKIHTTFPDGAEMVEEFDEKTDVLLVRKVRKAAVLGSKEPEWVFEVGQAPEAAFDPHADLMRASASNPIFLRKDTPEHFQWRVRNLPYPADVYSVTVDHEKQEIVVRTSNKKYYKRIGVPDLARAGVALQDNSLAWKHQHNTLIISYTRPPEVIELEQKALREADKSAVAL